MIDLYTNISAHQTNAMRLLGDGLRALDIDNQLRMTTGVIGKGKACVLWGTRYLERAQNYETVYILEAGYYGRDRLSYYSLGIGGLNGRADFNNEHTPSDRWLQHGITRQPWRAPGQGKYVLVMGQVPGDMSLRGIDIRAWYDTIIEEIRRHTNLPVYFRPHPKALQAGPTQGNAHIVNGALGEALEGAAYAVTYNSNSGVDAAIAGVPIYAEDMGSMAWPIAAHTLRELFDFKCPDRCQWLYNLAYTQWTADELSNGTAWRHIACHKHDVESETQ